MPDFRDVLFQEIYEYAKDDEKVVFLTADADAFVLKKFKKDFPKRFFNVGVAEQNAILVAVGFAMAGFKPYVYSITPFMTMRCYEQIKVNVCSMNLPITLIGLGVGFSFSFDGPTHHAISDIALMRTLPEMTILNTSDEITTKECVEISYNSKTPVFIRLDKGDYSTHMWIKDVFHGFRFLKPLTNINVLITGTILQECWEAVKELEVGIIDMYQLKPYDRSVLSLIIRESEKIIVVEENVEYGGLATILLELMGDINMYRPIIKISLEDKQYFMYGERSWIHEKCRIDVNSIKQKVKEVLNG